MALPAQDLTKMLGNANVVILITEAHPDRIIPHPAGITQESAER
jgi:hypothetical protein